MSANSSSRVPLLVTGIVLTWLTLLISAACMALGPVPATRTAPAPAVRAPVQGQAQTAANLVTEVTITGSEFKFSPADIQVPAGQPITIHLNNAGSVEHDITVDALQAKIVAAAGQMAQGTLVFDKPGTYEFYCSVPGHKEAGMKGTITAVGAGEAPPQPGPAAQAAYGADQTIQQQGVQFAIAKPTPQPVPDGTQALPAPQMAPLIERAQPATVQLDLSVQKRTALLAEGVAYEYWTFNGTVPGPMLRVRQGDTVELTLHNAPDAGVAHSIDLHAVAGPGGGGAVTQVKPGDSASFRFQALYPGVYVYHCATPMVPHHIAQGMYGLIVVEPPEGLPKVDHEYYVMQGDMYVQGERGAQGLRAFDMQKMLAEQPDYVVFNGHMGALSGDGALRAKVGETVRMFFGVGGPTISSRFHVICTVFDRVYPEGALANPITNVQTTHVPAGGATVVELRPQVPGTYTLVDHSLARLDKGGAGQLIAEGPDVPEIFQVLHGGSGGTGGH
jgi:nitrite reductase (NO-forming)